MRKIAEVRSANPLIRVGSRVERWLCPDCGRENGAKNHTCVCSYNSFANQNYLDYSLTNYKLTI